MAKSSNVLRNTTGDADKAAEKAKQDAFNTFIEAELAKIAKADKATKTAEKALSDAIDGARGIKEKVMIACANYANQHSFTLAEVNVAITHAIDTVYSNGKGGITLADVSRDNLASLLRNAMNPGFSHRAEKDITMAGRAYEAESKAIAIAKAKWEKDTKAGKTKEPFLLPADAPLHRKWSRRESMVKALSSLAMAKEGTLNKKGELKGAKEPVLFDNAAALRAYASDDKTGVPADTVRSRAITAALGRVKSAIDAVRQFGSCDDIDAFMTKLAKIEASHIKAGRDATDAPASRQENAITQEPTDGASDIDVDEAMTDDADTLAMKEYREFQAFKAMQAKAKK